MTPEDYLAVSLFNRSVEFRNEVLHLLSPVPYPFLTIELIIFQEVITIICAAPLKLVEWWNGMVIKEECLSYMACLRRIGFRLASRQRVGMSKRL
jgi:hypothetical protein